MDWIERIFHISPDGGSGSLEVGLAIGAAAVAIALGLAGVLKLLPSARRWSEGPLGRRRHTSSTLDRFDG